MKILVIVLILFRLKTSSAIISDTLKPNQTLQDNGQTLISSGQTFELGFFSPQNSTRRYIGIWFKNVPDLDVVWVANRDNPLAHSSPSDHILTITQTGNIIILTNNSVSPIWSSNSSAKNPTLQLLNSGNLVVINDENTDNYAWQSFDYPCDTQLAGMKLGWNLKAHQEWRLTSWKAFDDPSTGQYLYEIDPILPQLVQRKGSEIQFRTGPWDGVQFGGDPPLTGNPIIHPIFVFNETYAFYAFESSDKSALTRFWVNPYGTIAQLRWSDGVRGWVTIFTVQKDECDTFARCGPNGICSVRKNPVCGCPAGFGPRDLNDWVGLDWSGGCVREARLNCSSRVGFQKLSGLKLPYGSEFAVNRTVEKKEECEVMCRENCSCTAYSMVGVNGCVVWFGDLLDMKVYSDGGRALYVKMEASQLGYDGKRRAVIISMSVVLGFLLIIFFMIIGFMHVKRKRVISKEKSGNNSIEDHSIPMEEDKKFPSFGFDTIITATNDFCYTNKIGEGGFGPVYKGILPSGQEIAVKRLSKESGQGLAEFKNEIILILKLQHRNLVKLLGCCIHKEERMLIYEFMSNKSMDLYIFNQTKGSFLDWQKRFDIIIGIARGLLYLHRDSRLRIIHRDLKASNILLDHDMNPKISDFGLARILGGDQAEVNTDRVVGTYGYMSPEYAIDGHFSVKSDVFSFGVIVLEIVAGKKNRGFEHPDHDLNLIGHAWKLWHDGRPMELVDPFMVNVPLSEVLKCIQVGLLCVQKRPEERPLMSSALFMLESVDNPSLLQPKQPGFYTERSFTETDSSSSYNYPIHSNEITTSTLER